MADRKQCPRALVGIVWIVVATHSALLWGCKSEGDRTETDGPRSSNQDVSSRGSPPATQHQVLLCGFVRVAFDLDESAFPDEWRRAPIDIRVTPIQENEKQRSLAIAQRALEKYPRAVLWRFLRGITLVRTLQLHGHPFGGTASYSDKWLFICNDGASRGYSDVAIEWAIHHEFCSALLREHWSNFPHEDWTACLPTDFNYPANDLYVGNDARINRRIQKSADATFVTTYASVSFEEDVSETFAAVYTHSADAVEALRLSTRLKCKVKQVVEFMSRIDISFRSSMLQIAPEVFEF